MNAESFLAGLAECASTNDSAKASSFFHPHDDLHEALRDSLQHSSDAALLKTAKRYFRGDHDLISVFLVRYLAYLRDANPFFDDEAALRNAFRLLDSVYTQARQIFMRVEHAWFTGVLRGLTKALVGLAFRADELDPAKGIHNANSAARALTTTLNIATQSESEIKQSLVIHLASQVLRVYFHIQTLRTIPTVLKSTGSATDHLEDFPKADVVTFLYYTGRMLLIERHLHAAHEQLSRAFALCSATATSNQRSILVYLITASLVLGNFPSIDLLHGYGLTEVYEELIDALKAGHHVRVSQELDRWQSWHLKHGTYLLLREKLEVICWRNLIRKTLYVVDKPIGDSRSPNLRLDVLLRAAHLAFGDKELDVDDVEGMCVSLIDQGYIKAYINHSTSQIVFQRGGHYGFPPVSSIAYDA